ncbi:MAG: phosphoribosyltransferase family protein, partial [Thermoplasmata archaeon]
PRGGVVIGYEVAKALGKPLDITIPRKIGAPGNPELAIGAISEDGSKFYDEFLINVLGVKEDYIREKEKEEMENIKERMKRLRGERAISELRDKIVILVDDGLATGYTAKAAINLIKSREPRKIVLAVPIAPRETVEELKHIVDEVVVLEIPDYFYAVGQGYVDFSQVTDEEVKGLLDKARGEPKEQ